MSFVNNKCNIFELYLTDAGKKKYADGKFIVRYFDIVDLESNVDIPPNIINESNDYLSGKYGVDNLYKSEYIIDSFFNKIPVFECYTNEYNNECLYENSVCGQFIDDNLKYSVKINGKEISDEIIEIKSCDRVEINVEINSDYDNAVLDCEIEVEDVCVDKNDVTDINNCKYIKSNINDVEYTSYIDQKNNIVLSYQNKYYIPKTKIDYSKVVNISEKTIKNLL